jgi:hypothetical protein
VVSGHRCSGTGTTMTGQTFPSSPTIGLLSSGQSWHSCQDQNNGIKGLVRPSPKSHPPTDENKDTLRLWRRRRLFSNPALMRGGSAPRRTDVSLTGLILIRLPFSTKVCTGHPWVGSPTLPPPSTGRLFSEPSRWPGQCSGVHSHAGCSDFTSDSGKKINS